MKMKWWRGGGFLILCGAILAGCASAQTPPTAPTAQYTPAPLTAVPVAAPNEAPTDGQTAFLDGYRAYQNHDDARAIERLKFAADNFPALGDYALFYLALAQHDQGDLNGSAATLERLVQTYPESVMVDRGDMMLADSLLKLGRNAEAADVASRLIARGPEASIEQGARLDEARALNALGNPKAAYAQLMELRDKYPHSDADAEARSLVNSILASNPAVAETDSLAFHRGRSRVAAARRRAVRGRRAGQRRTRDESRACGSRANWSGSRRERSSRSPSAPRAQSSNTCESRRAGPTRQPRSKRWRSSTGMTIRMIKRARRSIGW